MNNDCETDDESEPEVDYESKCIWCDMYHNNNHMYRCPPSQFQPPSQYVPQSQSQYVPQSQSQFVPQVPSQYASQVQQYYQPIQPSRSQPMPQPVLQSGSELNDASDQETSSRVGFLESVRNYFKGNTNTGARVGVEGVEPKTNRKLARVSVATPIDKYNIMRKNDESHVSFRGLGLAFSKRSNRKSKRSNRKNKRSKQNQNKKSKRKNKNKRSKGKRKNKNKRSNKRNVIS